MDDDGNILVKRISKTGIYVKNTLEENSLSNDVLKLNNGLLDSDKPVKVRIHSYGLLYSIYRVTQKKSNKSFSVGTPCMDIYKFHDTSFLPANFTPGFIEIG